MSNDTVTIIVNGNSYQLSSTSSSTMRAMPATDRQQLLTLLKGVTLI